MWWNADGRLSPRRSAIISSASTISWASMARFPGLEGLSRDVVEAVLTQAARFCTDVVAR